MTNDRIQALGGSWSQEPLLPSEGRACVRCGTEAHPAGESTEDKDSGNRRDTRPRAVLGISPRKRPSMAGVLLEIQSPHIPVLSILHTLDFTNINPLSF